jgi:hypothetical protein
LPHFKPGEPRTRKREEAELLFPTIKEVLDLHKQAIEEFGGAHGLRDEAALESAIMAAENRAYYENVSLAICAATYAYHLSQAHAFIDGNNVSPPPSRNYFYLSTTRGSNSPMTKSSTCSWALPLVKSRETRSNESLRSE